MHRMRIHNTSYYRFRPRHYNNYKKHLSIQSDAYRFAHEIDTGIIYKFIQILLKMERFYLYVHYIYLNGSSHLIFKPPERIIQQILNAQI